MKHYIEGTCYCPDFVPKSEGSTTCLFCKTERVDNLPTAKKKRRKNETTM